MPSESTTIIVVYKPSLVETPDPVTVTIKYIYEENGKEAAPTYQNTFAPGTDFSVTSPVISDYNADQALVSGTVKDSNLEFTVVYTKVPTPPTPVDPNPVDPTPDTPTPSEPTPDVPIIPDNDLLDSGLLYLDPLGAVAYVPSTGIVNSATAGIFEQDFAEIILSQGFVMIALFIFSGSFALYFTNRKHLKPATAPRRSYATSKAPTVPKKAISKPVRNIKAVKASKVSKKTTTKGTKKK